jgi:hypothetical protein
VGGKTSCLMDPGSSKNIFSPGFLIGSLLCRPHVFDQLPRGKNWPKSDCRWDFAARHCRMLQIVALARITLRNIIGTMTLKDAKSDLLWKNSRGHLSRGHTGMADTALNLRGQPSVQHDPPGTVDSCGAGEAGRTIRTQRLHSRRHLGH